MPSLPSREHVQQSQQKITRSIQKGFRAQQQCMIFSLTQPDVNDKNAPNVTRKDGGMPFPKFLVVSLNTHVIPTFQQHIFPANQLPL